MASPLDIRPIAALRRTSSGSLNFVSDYRGAEDYTFRAEGRVLKVLKGQRDFAVTDGGRRLDLDAERLVEHQPRFWRPAIGLRGERLAFHFRPWTPDEAMEGRGLEGHHVRVEGEADEHYAVLDHPSRNVFYTSCIHFSIRSLGRGGDMGRMLGLSAYFWASRDREYGRRG